MEPTAALKQLAHYANTVPGLNVDYPATNKVKAPHLMLWFSTAAITGGNEQQWVMSAKGQLLGTVKGGDLKSDFIRVEDFFAPLADLFSPENPRAYLLQDLTTGDRVDICQLSTISSGLAIEWQGATYYGAELFWDIKLRRTAGATT